MNRPIGVFDSGIGGLSLLSGLVRALPHETFVYLADNASVPYGNRPLAEIAALALRCEDFLLKSDVKCVVVACNTITGNCIEKLREHSPVPVFGIEPALKPAHEQFGSRIGVLATLATLKCSKFNRLLRKLGEENFILFPSPNLAAAIEKNYLGNLSEAVSPCLADLHREDLSCLVLGCTHYVLAEKVIAPLAGLPLIHGNEGTVQHVRKFVEENGELHGVFSDPESARSPLSLFVTQPGSLPYYVNVLQRLGLSSSLRECAEVALGKHYSLE